MAPPLNLFRVDESRDKLKFPCVSLLVPTMEKFDPSYSHH